MSLDPDNSLLNSILTTRLGKPFQPQCKACQDLGIVFESNLNPGQGGRDAGTYELCGCQERLTRCDGQAPWMYSDRSGRTMRACPSRPARVKLERLRHLYKRSDIPRRYQGSFFSSIRPDQVHTDLMLAVEQSIELIAHMDHPDSVKGLYLYGPTGCGKTLLSCAILNEILRVFVLPVKYAKISRDILGRLQSTFNPNSDIYGAGKKIEAELGSVPALVIDDLGVQRETEWANQVLYDLIDTRYENDLLTVFTSNEPMESWRGIAGGRVLSRLREMCREFPIQMPDYREQIHADIQSRNLGPWGPA
ncbi:MAG: ATP-binding protein [Leptospiraceae bacterium]|nr:ATP-binding protein [Leptospiraceae bacterium]